MKIKREELGMKFSGRALAIPCARFGPQGSQI